MLLMRLLWNCLYKPHNYNNNMSSLKSYQIANWMFMSRDLIQLWISWHNFIKFRIRKKKNVWASGLESYIELDLYTINNFTDLWTLTHNAKRNIDIFFEIRIVWYDIIQQKHAQKTSLHQNIKWLDIFLILNRIFLLS